MDWSTLGVIEKFANEIESITDFDYGDFKRKANDVLLRLKNDLTPYINDDIKRKLSEMQMYTQFLPASEEVESTKAKLLSDAKYLKELLAAERQDWESAPRDAELNT